MAEVPAQLGPYRIRRLLGKGSCGTVYEAEHLESGALAAVKLIDATATRPQLRRFHREVRILRRLDDRHVVKYLDEDVGGAVPWLAMAYVEGHELSSVIEEAGGPVARKDARTWARDIAQALAAAHRASILHRDLKPANVIVDAQDRAVVIDFGLGKADSTATPLTATGMRMGTFAYFTPEQFEGRPFSPATDVYQWALIVHELLTGMRPHADLEVVTGLELRAREPVALPAAAAALDPDLAKLVERCLSPDPARRAASGEELLALMECAAPGPAGVGAARQDARPTPALLAPYLAGYRIERELGEGGMGVVFEARAPASGERVAVKVLKGLDGGPALERFHREFGLLASLSSPRVVRVLGHGQAGPWPYIVMEFLEGETLGDVLAREGRLAPARALSLFTPVVEGVAELHARGIVHRDLKPSNVLLAGKAGPRILDLGVARAVAGPPAESPRAFAGSFAYASPEALRGAVTPASDVYSLGAILYELLTGRRDFRGQDAATVLRGFLAADRRVSAAPLDRLVGLFRRAIAPRAEDRHPDARVLHTDVLELVSSLAGAGEPGAGGRDRASESERGPGRSPGSMRLRSPGEGSPPTEAQRKFEPGELVKQLLVALILAVCVATMLLLPEMLKRAGF